MGTDETVTVELTLSEVSALCAATACLRYAVGGRDDVLRESYGDDEHGIRARDLALANAACDRAEERARPLRARHVEAMRRRWG